MRLKTSLIACAALITGIGVADATVQAGASYAPPQDDGAPPPSEGPQGSSRLRAGEERFDRVGHAGTAGSGAGVFALSNLLPAGSHAEVTALDTGRTIVVAVRGAGSGLVDLSEAAAAQLGASSHAAVRIRRVTPSPQEAALLASGESAPPRADAPPALLAGLRRQLAPTPPGAKSTPASARPVRQPVAATPRPAPAPIAAPKPVPKPAPAATTGRGQFVQVAALSNLARAKALAAQLGGVVRSAGTVHRVQIGPYPDSAAAQRARADVAKRGYPDARIVAIP